MNNPPIFRSYGQGAESARNFFKCSLFHEKRGLEVPNFVTFPNSLFFWVFTVFLDDLEGAG